MADRIVGWMKHWEKGTDDGDWSYGWVRHLRAVWRHRPPSHPDEAVMRPRATVIPAGNPPDPRFEFPILNQTAKQNVTSGVVVYHSKEGALQESTMNLPSRTQVR